MGLGDYMHTLSLSQREHLHIKWGLGDYMHILSQRGHLHMKWGLGDYMHILSLSKGARTYKIGPG